MESIVIVIFVLGYLAIALEHPIKINKTATALLTGVVCWTLFALGSDLPVVEDLSHHLGGIAEILFFLLGAMTIVEMIDAYQGFSVITDKIRTENPKILLWIICWIAFFLSAILDNLTTSIVMVSVLRKLIPNKEMRLFFAGMIVIAANAGGAWTPIGDVTTTMLWIGGQITTVNIMKTLLIPSIACLLVPLIILSFTLKGSLTESEMTHEGSSDVKGKVLMLVVGVAMLIFVPIFKTITHLPPYIGMMFGLGITWVVSEFINPHADEEQRKPYTAAAALSRIDVSSMLFFLGILLAVGALESMHILRDVAVWLDETVKSQSIIITIIGLMSAIVDNVPLVAASMGMYDMSAYPVDHFIWEYLAYCAGTGGSILIIGSAAGVAVMGIEKIDFMWYLKKISLLALLGYLAGAGIYLILH
ncbi:MAG TPA: sodium:proton antiporter NhaD [Cyclobacteriaceae bacterium]